MAGALGALSAKGKGIAAAAGAKLPKPKGDEDGDWSWMPSPQAIAIAVIGMLALGVGLGSAMSEIADSAPISTILLEYPQHATEAPPAEEPEEEAEEEAPLAAGAPQETTSEEVVEEPLPEGLIEEPLPEEVTEEPELVPFNPEEQEEENSLEEKPLPEIKHAFLIVLGENSYESDLQATGEAPYLTPDAAEERRADPQLLRGDRQCARQRDRAVERPGPDRGNRDQLPQLHGDHPRHRLGLRRTGRRRPAASTRARSNRCRPSWKQRN